MLSEADLILLEKLKDYLKSSNSNTLRFSLAYTFKNLIGDSNETSNSRTS